MSKRKAEPLTDEALDNLRTKIKVLFDLLSIRRIVAVDDEFRDGTEFSEYLGVLHSLAAKKVEVPSYGDISQDPRDLLEARAREHWESLKAEERDTEYQDLLVRAEAQAATDHVDDLYRIFDGHDFIALTPSKWDKRKEELVEQAASCKTLFLFDQDQRKAGLSEHAGLDQIFYVINSCSVEVAVCALLSHTFQETGEVEAWQQNTEAVRAQPDKANRIVPISKDRLRDDPSKFPLALRLAGLPSIIQDFTTKAFEALDAAQDEAKERLKAFNIFDLEYMVFETSEVEGVSELDTLFRLHQILHRHGAQAHARKTPVIDESVRRMRALRSVAKMPRRKTHTSTSWLRTMELYVDAEELNHHHLPLDIGDIFEHDSEGRFILLGPQCDLMMRKKGRKAASGILVKVINQTRGSINVNQRELFHPLPELNTGESEETYASFRESYPVSFDALDPSVYRTDGRTEFVLGDACPSRVLQFWQSRFTVIQERLQQDIEAYRTLIDKGVEDALARRVLQPVSTYKNFEPKVDLARQAIDYGFRRAARLTQAHAYALLIGYMQFIARPAFEHDFSISK